MHGRNRARLMLKLLLWRGLTLLFLAMAIIGAVLPGIPTIEFLLLAVWSSSQGWSSVHLWLLNHARFGPMIQQWKQHRIMSRRAKIVCSVAMGSSACLLLFSGMALWLKLITVTVMAVVLIWLLSRPKQISARSQQT